MKIFQGTENGTNAWCTMPCPCQIHRPVIKCVIFGRWAADATGISGQYLRVLPFVRLNAELPLGLRYPSESTRTQIIRFKRTISRLWGNGVFYAEYTGLTNYVHLHIQQTLQTATVYTAIYGKLWGTRGGGGGGDGGSGAGVAGPLTPRVQPSTPFLDLPSDPLPTGSMMVPF